MSSNLFKLNGQGEKFVNYRFADQTNFGILKTYFENLELEFIYSRTQVFVSLNSDNDDSGAESISYPYALGVVPTFKSFNFETESSHMAGSIVGLVSKGVATFIGALATVSHNPLQVTSIKLIEVNPDGTINETLVERAQIESESPEDLATVMGSPNIELSQWKLEIPATTNIGDTSALANIAFNNIISDQYASPLYPDGGVQRLLNDSTIADKFSLAVRQRYQVALLGGIKACCSTSTSCNGCTSSSCSCFGRKPESEPSEADA